MISARDSLLVILCCGAFACISAAPACAQENEPSTKAETVVADARPAVDPILARRLGSPRAAIQTLLEGDQDDALECLDLSEYTVTEETRRHAGSLLAFKLRHVIVRMVYVAYDYIPDDEFQEDTYNLVDQAGWLEDEDVADVERIRLSRGADGLWQFSPTTVAAIDELYDRWEDRSIRAEIAAEAEEPAKPFAVWLMEQFPKVLQNRTRFLLPDYQWICVVAVIFLGFVADLVVRLLLSSMTRAWFKYRGEESARVQLRFWRPVGLFCQALVWYIGTTLIGLPPSTLTVLLVGLKFFAVIAAIWTAFHIVDLLAGALAKKAEKTDTRFDDLLVPLVSKTLKVLAVCVGLLQCAQMFDLPIAGLLGGLGLGGMAFALASRDAVSNLFGSFTILVDRPFEVGDWVITEEIEGTVETVGFRSTRIRTFYNSLITLPNSRLTTAVVDNMGRRTFRRIKTRLGLQYDSTPEQIEAFCEGVRELIRRHPYTRKDYYHVYLNEFNSSSLDILLYCFVECPDWSIELRERHRLFVDILTLAKRVGVSFAFPTRTLHIYGEDNVEPNDLHQLADPLRSGQRLGAQVAGRPWTGRDRPGNVEFRGPSPSEQIGTEREQP